VEFSADRNSIIGALANCVRAAKDGKNDHTRGVLVEVHAKETWLTTINPPVSVSCEVSGATSGTTGSALLSATGLFERIRAMPDGIVKIASSKSSVVMSGPGHRRKYDLSTLSREGFSKFPERPAQKICEIPAAALRDLIKRVAYSVGGDGSADAHTLISVAVSPGRIEAAATNGHTVAIVTAEDEGVGGTGTFSITRHAHGSVELLAAQLAKEPISVYADHTGVHMTCDAGEIKYLLPNVQPLPVADVIRKHAAKGTVDTDRAQLLAAAKAITVGVDGAVCISTIRFCGGEARLEARTKIGTNQETIDTSGDADFSFVLNAHLLISTLSAIQEDTVRVGCDHSNMVSFSTASTLACVCKADPERIAHAA
jgi:DNA polymerase III sliding clamp (beta) subunit (PCNA family)